MLPSSLQEHAQPGASRRRSKEKRWLLADGLFCYLPMVLPRRGLTQRGAWLVNWLLIASAAAIAALVGFRGHGAGLVRVRRLGTPTAADTLSLSQRVELLEAQLQAHTALGADPLAAEAPVAGVQRGVRAGCKPRRFFFHAFPRTKYQIQQT